MYFNYNYYEKCFINLIIVTYYNNNFYFNSLLKLIFFLVIKNAEIIETNGTVKITPKEPEIP